SSEPTPAASTATPRAITPPTNRPSLTSTNTRGAWIARVNELSIPTGQPLRGSDRERPRMRESPVQRPRQDRTFGREHGDPGAGGLAEHDGGEQREGTEREVRRRDPAQPGAPRRDGAPAFGSRQHEREQSGVQRQEDDRRG